MSASAQFTMPALTAAMRAALQAIDNGALLALLDAAGALLWPDPNLYQPQTNFEHLLGPLDRLALLLRGPLLGMVGTVAQQQAALNAASAAVDAIYVRGVGTVLRVLDAIAVHDAPVRELVDWILGGITLADRAAIYTVNYDTLLDRWLLDADHDAARPAIQLDDEFALLNPASLKSIALPGVVPPDLGLIPLRPSYLGRPANNTTHLYHLHGALHWVDYQGETHKARDIDDLRLRDIFARWAAGQALPIRPHVLLTDQKTRAVALEPFAQNYAALRDDLPLADRVMIAGYAFGDVPLNEALADGWAQRKAGSRWLVVDRSIFLHGAKQQRALRAFGHLPPGPVPDFYWGGVPGVVGARAAFWA